MSLSIFSSSWCYRKAMIYDYGPLPLLIFSVYAVHDFDSINDDDDASTNTSHLTSKWSNAFTLFGACRFGVSQGPLRKPLAICKHHFAFSQVTPVGVPLSATRYKGIKKCLQPFGQSPPCWCFQFTVKFLNIGTPEKLLLLFQNLNNVSLPQSNESKRCRWNGEQCRPWSDCSSRSSLIWVYTVCPGLPVWKLRIITWRQSQSFCKTCIYHNDPEFPGRQVWTVYTQIKQSDQVYTVCHYVCIFGCLSLW